MLFCLVMDIEYGIKVLTRPGVTIIKKDIKRAPDVNDLNKTAHLKCIFKYFIKGSEFVFSVCFSNQCYTVSVIDSVTLLLLSLKYI